jgi:hypothetical protein
VFFRGHAHFRFVAATATRSPLLLRLAAALKQKAERVPAQLMT